MKYLCYKFAQLLGWKYKTVLPKNINKYVAIGLPHTSNWDFLMAMAFFGASGMKGKFTIKKEWLKFPLKTLMESNGAIGIDRETIASSGHQNLTDYMASLITNAQEFAMLVTPEGTRRPTDKWKTGFYYTALKANVPIALGFADYKAKEFGIGKIIYPKDFVEDMREIVQFYLAKQPKHPEKFLVDKRFI